MNWTELLKAEMDAAYASTEGLFAMVDDGALDWKPSTGSNWMTTGQVLKHTAEACGMCFKGFVTGEWPLPEGVSMEDLTPEQMLPPAEAMETVSSVAEAKQLLADDKQTAIDMLAACDETKLDSEPCPAPWDPTPIPLGSRLLMMVGHLQQHKAQLFYYLKLQGHPVNTGHLYGMG